MDQLQFLCAIYLLIVAAHSQDSLQDGQGAPLPWPAPNLDSAGCSGDAADSSPREPADPRTPQQDSRQPPRASASAASLARKASSQALGLAFAETLLDESQPLPLGPPIPYIHVAESSGESLPLASPRAAMHAGSESGLSAADGQVPHDACASPAVVVYLCSLVHVWFASMHGIQLCTTISLSALLWMLPKHLWSAESIVCHNMFEF